MTYKVTGIFEIRTDGDNAQEAQEKAERILKADGIGFHIVEVLKSD